jgi:hypothetical protein
VGQVFDLGFISLKVLMIAALVLLDSITLHCKFDKVCCYPLCVHKMCFVRFPIQMVWDTAVAVILQEYFSFKGTGTLHWL